MSFYARYSALAPAAGGVESLNGLEGALTLIAGSGVTITPSGTEITISAPENGTVTSVAMSVPSFLSVAGSPVTSSGTLAVTLSGTAITVADGNAGAPIYSFASDTNTGMFLLAPDVLSLSTGGTNRLAISNSDINFAAGMTTNYLSGTAVAKFWNTGGTFGVTLRGNASQVANTTFQLPIDNGTNGYFLQTNGSGITSWAEASSFDPLAASIDFLPDEQVALTSTITSEYWGGPLDGLVFDSTALFTEGNQNGTGFVATSDRATGTAAALYILGGKATVSGNGGAVFCQAGDSTAGSGAVFQGAGGAGDINGGNAELVAGNGVTGNGGSINLSAGAGGTNNGNVNVNGQDINLSAAGAVKVVSAIESTITGLNTFFIKTSDTTGSTASSDISVVGGETVSGTAGHVSLIGGSTDDGVAGDASITGGTATDAAGTPGWGLVAGGPSAFAATQAGSVLISGGGNTDGGLGGDVTLRPGTGTTGNIILDDSLALLKLVVPATITGGGTTGAQEINKISGTVNFAAAASSLVVTNSLVTTSSIVFAVVRTNDTTAVIKNVVPTNGSFTITLNAAANAETSVGFLVLN